jgi:hypothetical protein
MKRFALLLLLAPCSKSSHGSDAAADANVASASTAVAVGSDAGPIASAAASASSAPVDVDKANIDLMKRSVVEIEDLVNRGLLKDPSRPDGRDAPSRCEELDALRPRLEARPELKTLLDEEHRVCTFDVPLESASETVRQITTTSPSQASVRMMCGFATRDLNKARAFRPSDPKLRKVDARYRQACH